MKIKASMLEAAALIILFLATLWLWSLPFHENRLPFGDVDASSHFIVGDHMVSQDRSIVELPYIAKFRYQGQNSAYPNYLWYPPQYWTNTAIAQILGGERILPFFLMVAIMSSLIILSSYLLVRSLYGPGVALLSSLLLAFSTRDYMVYLFGQWPQSLSFAFTPLVLYCVYRLYELQGEENKEKKWIYGSMLGIFLAAQFFFHPQGLIASGSASALFILLLLIKERKWTFPLKQGILAMVIAILLAIALAPFNVGEFAIELVPGGEDSAPQPPIQLGKLFLWYQGIKGDQGIPDFYFTYDQSHGWAKDLNGIDKGIIAWWTLPFLLVGAGVMFVRRSPKDILWIGWLISYYIMTHLRVLNLSGRDIRMFAYEGHIFYPLIAIGVLTIPSLLGNQQFKAWAKYGLIALFLALALSLNAVSAYKTLSGMQNSIGRINPYQYEAAEWIRLNLPQDSHLYDFGTVGFQNYAAKIKWMMSLSQHHFIVDDSQRNLTNYIFIDYSDAILLQNQDYVNAIRQFESQINATPLYDRNNIRIYRGELG